MSAISFVPGYKLVARCDPKNLMAGMTTSHANTPPEKITPAMRGPMMYPTPRYSVVVLARNEPPGSHFGLYVGVLGQTENMFSVWPSTPTYNPKWRSEEHTSEL